MKTGALIQLVEMDRKYVIDTGLVVEEGYMCEVFWLGLSRVMLHTEGLLRERIVVLYSPK